MKLTKAHQAQQARHHHSILNTLLKGAGDIQTLRGISISHNFASVKSHLGCHHRQQSPCKTSGVFRPTSPGLTCYSCNTNDNRDYNGSVVLPTVPPMRNRSGDSCQCGCSCDAATLQPCTSPEIPVELQVNVSTITLSTVLQRCRWCSDNVHVQ